MPFQKGNKIGNRFSSTNQPANRGQNGRKFSIIKKSKGDLSAEDCRKRIANILAQTRTQVLELATDTETDIFSAVISKSLAEGDFKALIELLKFTYGTKTEIDAKINAPAMTHEEVAEIIKGLYYDKE